MIDSCIVPAAGSGTRWLPVSNYIPKEMLPLAGKPIIEWTIKEAIDSGCTKAYIVLSKRNEVIYKYLSKNENLNQKIKLEFIYNNKSRGLAHSIYKCRNYIGNSPYCVAIPDVPTISRVPVLHQLITVFQKLQEPAHLLSFCNFPITDLHLYSECHLKLMKQNLYEIDHFCPLNAKKGRPHHPGVKLRMSGRYIFLGRSFNTIKQLLKAQSQSEIKDDHLIQKEYKSGIHIYGVKVNGKTFDTGNPTVYANTNMIFTSHYLKNNT